MVTKTRNISGIDIIPLLNEIGFDYAELSISHLCLLSDSELVEVKHVLLESGIPAEACNNFFPHDLRLTGPYINTTLIVNHLGKVFDICSFLGIKSIVFGSGGARNVPDGFSRTEAKNQLAGLLGLINSYAAKHDIMIVIEPLRHQECNIINTYREALELKMSADVSNVKCLLDFYHLCEEKEDLNIIRTGGNSLEHVHLSNPSGRIFPLKNEMIRFLDFYSCLLKAGYDGRISIEAYSSDFIRDARESLEMLRGIENELKTKTKV